MVLQPLSLLRPSLSRWGARLGIGVAVALLLASCTTQPQAGTGVAGDSGAEGSYEAQLAQHLADTGSLMYGAYWCPHCADQKALFQQAVELVPYVECAADGENAQPELCQQRGIEGYPTWEIGGQLYPGVKSLNELATMSGFAAPQ